MIAPGLKPLSLIDHEKNFKYRVGGLVSLPSLKDIPSRWVPDFPEEWILNQAEYDPANDECGGASASLVLSILNGYRIDPHFLWAMARQRSGAKVEDFGVTNRDLADTVVKIGALLFEDSPYSFKDGRDKIADITNWDVAGLIPKALLNKAGSFVWVHPTTVNGVSYDAFDVFRASIWKFNNLYKKKHGAVLGLTYGYDSSQEYFDQITESGSGHDMASIGWYDDYAVVPNSLGFNAGKHGVHKIHRRVINRWAEEYGMPIFIDATQEQIKDAIARGVKLDEPYRSNFIFRLWEKILALFAQKPKGVMLWDTPSHIRRNVRIMCDNAGVSFFTKNIICAIIKQESNWNPKAVGPTNTNGTKDWGLVQVNDSPKFWIGPGLTFASTDEVLNDPEKCVRFIIKWALRGKLSYWSSYTSKAYLKWLASESLPSVPY